MDIVASREETVPDWALVLVSIGGSLVVALVSGLAAARATVAGARAELEKEVLARTDEKRRSLYHDFMKMMTDALFGSKRAATDLSKDEKLRDRMMDFKMTSLLVSSDNVIESFTRWGRDQRLSDDEKRYAAMRDFADIVLAMRKDMDYKDTNLTRRQILQAFVTDLDEQRDLLAFLER